jgi:hypothetical protein
MELITLSLSKVIHKGLGRGIVVLEPTFKDILRVSYCFKISGVNELNIPAYHPDVELKVRQ